MRWVEDDWWPGTPYGHVVYLNSGDPVVIRRLVGTDRWVVASNYAAQTNRLPQDFDLETAKRIVETMRILNTVPAGWEEGEWQR